MIQHVIKGGDVDVEDYGDGKALVITHQTGDQTVLVFDADGASWVGRRLKGEPEIEVITPLPIVETQ